MQSSQNNVRSIQEIPSPYRTVFRDYPCFNVVQSTVLDEALKTDNSLVVSAPTGSGKTAIFEMAIIRHLMQYRDLLDTYQNKIVYISPIKALCEERLVDWYKKFVDFGVRCISLTSDTDDIDVKGILQYNLIIATPEKWDVVSRRWRSNEDIIKCINLFLIDEVHLLNVDSRGPILEVIVSRMKTAVASFVLNQEKASIRFVALSATIPNIEDIAEWIGPSGAAKHFRFSEDVRPVALNKIVLGYYFNQQSQTHFKFDMSLNYKLPSLIMKYSEGKPTLIFCNTRKSVEMTANHLVQNLQIRLSQEQKNILVSISEKVTVAKLKQHIVHGIAFHHAGLIPDHRHSIEESFRNGLLPILVTTSTLAMGVNLPAHLVIVKSTKCYKDAGYRDYDEVSIFQMIGRAGRCQFDTTATALILTSQQDKQKFDKMLGCTQTIESNLHKHLAEHLNAEIVLKTITDLEVAMRWLSSTFLYVRATKSPEKYRLPAGLSKDKIDKRLLDQPYTNILRIDVQSTVRGHSKDPNNLYHLTVQSVPLSILLPGISMCQIDLNKLVATGMIKMNEAIEVTPTVVGEIMAKYYVAFDTMKLFTQITGEEILIQILAIISKCKEFSGIFLRNNDKKCLNMLNKNSNKESNRFPLYGRIKTVDMKVNCIIQAILGNLEISDQSILCDATKIMRSCERLSKCLIEYLQTREKCYSALLNATILAKCFSVKLWENSPYVSKQLTGIGQVISTLLMRAGKTSFREIASANPRHIEMIVNRKSPFGSTVVNEAAHLPQYNLTLDKQNGKVMLTLVLENPSDIEEKSTVDVNSIMTLLVGDSNNNILLYEKYSHAYMLENPEIRRSIDTGNEKIDFIKADFISENWVGIDCSSKLELSHDVNLNTNQTKNHKQTFMDMYMQQVKKVPVYKKRNEMEINIRNDHFKNAKSNEISENDNNSKCENTEKGIPEEGFENVPMKIPKGQDNREYNSRKQVKVKKTYETDTKYPNKSKNKNIVSKSIFHTKSKQKSVNNEAIMAEIQEEKDTVEEEGGENLISEMNYSKFLEKYDKSFKKMKSTKELTAASNIGTATPRIPQEKNIVKEKSKKVPLSEINSSQFSGNSKLSKNTLTPKVYKANSTEFNQELTEVLHDTNTLEKENSINPIFNIKCAEILTASNKATLTPNISHKNSSEYNQGFAKIQDKSTVEKKSEELSISRMKYDKSSKKKKCAKDRRGSNKTTLTPNISHKNSSEYKPGMAKICQDKNIVDREDDENPTSEMNYSEFSKKYDISYTKMKCINDVNASNEATLTPKMSRMNSNEYNQELAKLCPEKTIVDKEDKENYSKISEKCGESSRRLKYTKEVTSLDGAILMHNTYCTTSTERDNDNIKNSKEYDFNPTNKQTLKGNVAEEYKATTNIKKLTLNLQNTNTEFHYKKPDSDSKGNGTEESACTKNIPDKALFDYTLSGQKRKGDENMLIEEVNRTIIIDGLKNLSENVVKKKTMDNPDSTGDFNIFQPTEFISPHPKKQKRDERYDTSYYAAPSKSIKWRSPLVVRSPSEKYSPNKSIYHFDFFEKESLKEDTRCSNELRLGSHNTSSSSLNSASFDVYEKQNITSGNSSKKKSKYQFPLSDQECKEERNISFNKNLKNLGDICDLEYFGLSNKKSGPTAKPTSSSKSSVGKYYSQLLLDSQQQEEETEQKEKVESRNLCTPQFPQTKPGPSQFSQDIFSQRDSLWPPSGYQSPKPSQDLDINMSSPSNTNNYPDKNKLFTETFHATPMEYHESCPTRNISNARNSSTKDCCNSIFVGEPNYKRPVLEEAPPRHHCTPCMEQHIHKTHISPYFGNSPRSGCHSHLEYLPSIQAGHRHPHQCCGHRSALSIRNSYYNPYLAYSSQPPSCNHIGNGYPYRSGQPYRSRIEDIPEEYVDHCLQQLDEPLVNTRDPPSNILRPSHEFSNNFGSFIPACDNDVINRSDFTEMKRMPMSYIDNTFKYNGSHSCGLGNPMRRHGIPCSENPLGNTQQLRENVHKVDRTFEYTSANVGSYPTTFEDVGLNTHQQRLEMEGQSKGSLRYDNSDSCPRSYQDLIRKQNVQHVRQLFANTPKRQISHDLPGFNVPRDQKTFIPKSDHAQFSIPGTSQKRLLNFNSFEERLDDIIVPRNQGSRLFVFNSKRTFPSK